jgi:hypothetical protein
MECLLLTVLAEVADWHFCGAMILMWRSITIVEGILMPRLILIELVRARSLQDSMGIQNPIRDMRHGTCCDIFPSMSQWHGCVVEILLKS